MNKVRKLLRKTDKSWLVVWGLIYGSFLILGAFFPDFWGVTLLHYLGIALTFVYAYQKFNEDYLLQLALAVTLLADTILMVNNVSLIGVMIFALAQLAHLGRFFVIKMRNLWWYVIVVVLALAFGIVSEINPIFVAASIYGVTLGLNYYLAWKWHRERPCAGSWCARYGFLLFIACDVCVVGSYFSLIGVLPPLIYPLANYLAWVFYFPAQILIANSSKLNKTVLQ